MVSNFNNHYKYRGSVDSHNAKRHSPMSLESTWASKRWPVQVFGFISALTEVNVYLAWRYNNRRNDDKKNISVLEFWRKFARALVFNNYLCAEFAAESPSGRRSRRINNTGAHTLMTLPKKTKFSKTFVVASVANYPQFKCVSCPKRIRTYCRCSPGTYRCNACFAKHYADSNIDDWTALSEFNHGRPTTNDPLLKVL